MSTSRRLATILTVPTLLCQVHSGTRSKVCTIALGNYRLLRYSSQFLEQLPQQRHFAQSTLARFPPNISGSFIGKEGVGGINANSRNILTDDTKMSRRYDLHLKRHQSSTSGGGKRVVPFILPDIGEGIKEVVIREWQIKVGDSVKEFDGICEVESDKATATISSRFEGIISKIHYQAGDTASVGQPLVDIELTSGDDASSAVTPTSASNPETSGAQRATAPPTSGGQQQKPIQQQVGQTQGQTIPTLPSIRRLAHENGVDLSRVTPSGKHGRILREDLDRYLTQQRQQEQQQPVGHTNTTTTPIAGNLSLEVEVPLKHIQRVMFKTMTQSLKIPHFNYADEVDLTLLTEATKRYHNSTGVKIANFAFIIKMVSMALREYPELNASLDSSNEKLIVKHYHNIGVAIDTKQGLIVPNIKNVQSLTVEQVNSEMLRLRELGYSGKLTPTDLTGGTISLSNIGAIGGIFGVPVIVSPELVIGALGRTRVLPRFNSQGGIEARQVVQLVWSADHRIVDGATISRFSNLLKQFLEDPHAALLKAI